MIVTRNIISWKRGAMMIVLLTILVGILIITWGTWVPTNNHILRTFVVSHGDLAVDSSLQRAYVMPYEDGAISTFDTAQGTLVRTTTLATGPIGYVPLAGIDAADGWLFMPQPTRPNAWGGNVIDILDARTGLLRGSTTLPVRAPILQLAVDASTKRVFVVTTMTLPPTSAAYVCVIDARTGRLVRCIPVSNDTNGFAIDPRTGHVFVADPDGDRVLMLNGLSGRIEQTETFGFPPQSPVIDEQSGHVFVSSMIDGTVGMLDARTGRIIRTIAVTSQVAVQSREVITSPVIATATRRAFVCAANSNHMWVLDVQTGQVLHSVTLPGQACWVSMDERNGYLLVHTSSHTLVRLDARSGRVVRTTTAMQNLSNQSNSVMAETRTGRLFLSDLGPVDRAGAPLGLGTIRVIDLRSGALLATIPVGAAPATIALDESAGRALVMNEGARVARASSDPWGWIPPGIRAHLPFVPRPPPVTWTIPASVTVIDVSPWTSTR